ncbi:PDPN protein, partial [Pomatostomus ruficeps]|nr:PDPN protein [Pomatostomus ruficeps]
MFIKVPFFILVLGSVPFVALAQEASSVLEGEESATIDFRDRNYTEFEESPTGLPTRLHNVINLLQFGHLKTTESSFPQDEEIENSTVYEVNTEGVDGERSGEPEKTDEGGLGTIALVGIIVGIIVAVGILAGIVIAVVRKMSGR